MPSRRFALLLLLPLAASAPAQQAQVPLEQTLEQARREEAAANAETVRLERAAASARSDADKLQAQQAAAAQALEAAEARITAAQTQVRLAQAQATAFRQQLSEEQRPVSSLLAGLATMGQRPPLLALADRGSVDDFVRVGVLLDITLPVIRARTRALSSQLAHGQQLEAAAIAARNQLLDSRKALVASQQRFASLQRLAIDRSLTAGSEALGTGDAAISANEQIARLQSEQARAASAGIVARALEAEPPLPPRPGASGSAPAQASFAYVLPVDAPVDTGLGTVDDSGVRSRGIVLRTGRGQPVVAPASGTVRYAGPFRDYDGLVILDHGNGWLSVLVNVSTTLKVGDRVVIGQPLGRTLGPLQLQLSAQGRLLSPALIAGSSGSLSKADKGS